MKHMIVDGSIYRRLRWYERNLWSYVPWTTLANASIIIAAAILALTALVVFS